MTNVDSKPVGRKFENDLLKRDQNNFDLTTSENSKSSQLYNFEVAEDGENNLLKYIVQPESLNFENDKNFNLNFDSENQHEDFRSISTNDIISDKTISNDIIFDDTNDFPLDFPNIAADFQSSEFLSIPHKNSLKPTADKDFQNFSSKNKNKNKIHETQPLNKSESDILNLRSNAKLVDLAYCSDKRVKLSPGITVRYQGTSDGILIIFAGQEDELDEHVYERYTLTNYKNPKIKNALVHQNLYNEFLTVREKFLGLVMKQIDSKKTPSFQTILIGHSLGGVYAIFAGLALKELRPNLVIPVIRTYGSPRVGNQVFANYANTQIRLIRSTLSNDDIPRRPVLHPYIFWGNKYTHFGDEYWTPNVDAGRVVKNCPTFGKRLESEVKENLS
ncbi:hypothetical protein G9A89_015086 [Geosiphon pyriformis]|nr:hypothetical protein G9A89_015086 [Geosiphon pyriformis]